MAEIAGIIVLTYATLSEAMLALLQLRYGAEDMLTHKQIQVWPEFNLRWFELAWGLRWGRVLRLKTFGEIIPRPAEVWTKDVAIQELGAQHPDQTIGPSQS